MPYVTGVLATEERADCERMKVLWEDLLKVLLRVFDWARSFILIGLCRMDSMPSLRPVTKCVLSGYTCTEEEMVNLK